MNNYIGALAAAGAFIMWGVLPAYWKLLHQVPAYEILCHRMAWSLVLTFGLIVLLKRQEVFRQAIKVRENLVTFTITAVLLAINWLLYIWAVNAGFIVEASLGYFINPLINVLFGMIFFRERMRPMQWAAIFFAAVGVVYLTVYYGQFPWIALVLGFSFATYGLLHKKSQLGALDALCLETGMLFIPAVVFLLGLELYQGGSFGHINLSSSMLLAGTGIVTTVPLLLFGFAAHRIPLSTLGVLQYLAPSINLLLGVFIYGEDFSRTRMIGFIFIWMALALYMAENMTSRFMAKKRSLAK